ncbi:hypothetical protein Q9R19_04070 [Microbacterium sp. ARD32]|uniref:hypothetical protein n=1 Tax=Microbacterium sp. ARD32 TaxID=2962577 RepID=UPI0028818084|nr:hypothetical protein [Microbacterium sp. ARD32]MDT0156799.1 hypothetical protein [Microbacterium sp. ARD32]
MSPRLLKPVAVMACVAILATALTACEAHQRPGGTRIETTSDIALRSEIPGEDSAAMAADESAVPAVAPTDYFMLRPMELTSDEMPAEGITLRAELPAELPEGAQARFAYFDEGTASWTPVETETDGRTVTATTTHLSMWSIVVTFLDDVSSVVKDRWDAAGAVWKEVGTRIGDSWAAWSAKGPGSWVYRQAGLLLGLQTEAPQCEGDWTQEPGLAWVDTAVITQLDGIPVENQSVLRCVGVDPEDGTRLQIKAAANRGFGFRVQFAAGLEPHVSWSYLADLATADVAALSELLSEELADVGPAGPVGAFQNLLVGTTEMSFSVSESEVRQAQATGERLVSFVRPDELQLATSVLLKMAFDLVEGVVSDEIVWMTVALAVRECIGANLPGEGADAATVASWAVGCLQSIVDQDFLEAVDDVTTEIATNKDARFSPKTKALFEAKDARTLFGKVLHALKWIDVVTFTLTMTDYSGERLDDPWGVDVTAAPLRPRWEDLEGTWCHADGNWCRRVAPGTHDGVITVFDAMMGDCIQGTSSSAEGGGVMLVYCPAGAATPADVPGAAPGLPPVDDDADFDRLFAYQGYGTITEFRHEDIRALGGA